MYPKLLTDRYKIEGLFSKPLIRCDHLRRVISVKCFFTIVKENGILNVTYRDLDLHFLLIFSYAVP